jgi:hypothetical protein
MRTAIRDLSGIRIAIAPQLVTWIAANEVGDENALESRLRDHTP